MLSLDDPYHPSSIVQNKSRLPGFDVHNLASFVFARVNPNTVAKTRVDMVDSHSYRMSGLAYRPDYERMPVALKPGQHFYIRLDIGGSLTYSYEWLYRKRAGASLLNSWDEEFLYVLSHEMCHAMQYDRANGFGRAYQYEVEAELFAKEALAQYRAHKAPVSFPVDLPTFLPPMEAIKR